MATATKNARTLQSSGTNNASDTATGTAVNLSTALGALATGIVTNGGTGPTVGCDFVVQVSNDNSVWREYSRQTAGTTSNTTYTFAVELPAATMYVRSVFGGNTGQNVTVAAELHELTSIA